MKKYLLIAAVVVALGAYGLVFRHGSKAPVSIAATPSQPSSGSTSASTTKTYKDGTYTGSVENAYYGNIQVAAVVSGGKLTDVTFLQSPNDNPNSLSVNSQATPVLKQEAISAQSAQVDSVTGATDTSQAFVQSLGSALSQAE
jgi:uncharacterized protein with FMN-binding domain